MKTTETAIDFSMRISPRSGALPRHPSGFWRLVVKVNCIGEQEELTEQTTK